MTDTPPRWSEYVPVDLLVPHPKNPKGHDIALLRASLGRWGYTMPVLICERTGLLAAGHGRRLIVLDDQETGAPAADGVVVGDDGRYQIPVMRGWSSVDDAELEAYVIADNATTMAGGWIDQLLAESLKVVRDTPLAFDGVGFAAGQLDDLIARLTPPSLDDLVGRHGEPDPASLWPVIRFKVPPEERDRWLRIAAIVGGDEREQFVRVMDAAEEHLALKAAEPA